VGLVSLHPSHHEAAAPDLTQCDTEPIHAPGAVQPHGALLAYDPDDGRITHWSENLADVLPLAGASGFGFVHDVLGVAATRQIDAFDREATPIGTRPMSLALTSGASVDVEVHRSDGLIVLEFEAPSGETDETREALLRELRLAVIRLESATDAQEVCSIAVHELRRLTGYDRVMVYRFHADDHGEVIAESRDPQLASYQGLHYPASDVPRPARRLLRLSPTRVIADVDAGESALMGPDDRRASVLDLSRSALRAVSPIQLQYLRNMGVAASLTISLADGPRLWGLLACHHGTPHRPRPALRVACEVLARTTWLRIDAQEQRSQHARERDLQASRVRLTAGLSSVGPLASALVEDRRAVLDMLGADGIHVRIDGASISVGATPPKAAIEALIDVLRDASPGVPHVTDSLREILPPGAAGSSVAGALAIPVESDWSERIVWFRNEQARAITWAGNPEKPTLEGTTPGGSGEAPRLSPRRSFEAWRETVRGRSVAWTQPEIDAAIAFAETLPDVRRARARDALAMLAMRDTLTGLPNRALLLDRLEVALLDLRRGQRGLSILFLDLDGFKEVNDTFGHEAGDLLLVEVASRLRRTVRAIDTVARLGGDEFVIVCPSDAEAPDGAAMVESLAGRLLEVLAEPIDAGGRWCTVTASIGIASVTAQQSSADALGAADAAMYRAKREGPNRMSR
jgi:diguanylate cyclase (GGDEF)-like protein